MAMWSVWKGRTEASGQDGPFKSWMEAGNPAWKEGVEAQLTLDCTCDWGFVSLIGYFSGLLSRIRQWSAGTSGPFLRQRCPYLALWPGAAKKLFALDIEKMVKL